MPSETSVSWSSDSGHFINKGEREAKVGKLKEKQPRSAAHSLSDICICASSLEWSQRPVVLQELWHPDPPHHIINLTKSKQSSTDLQPVRGERSEGRGVTSIAAAPLAAGGFHMWTIFLGSEPTGQSRDKIPFIDKRLLLTPCERRDVSVPLWWHAKSEMDLWAGCEVSVLLECEKCGRTGSDKCKAAFLYTGVSSLRTDAYVFLRPGEDFFFQHGKDEHSHKTSKKCNQS